MPATTTSRSGFAVITQCFARGISSGWVSVLYESDCMSTWYIVQIQELLEAGWRARSTVGIGCCMGRPQTSRYRKNNASDSNGGRQDVTASGCPAADLTQGVMAEERKSSCASFCRSVASAMARVWVHRQWHFPSLSGDIRSAPWWPACACRLQMRDGR